MKTKECSKCKETKSTVEFARRGEGLQAWCKPCKTAHKREWLKNNRDKERWNKLWSRYRIRPEDWQRMWNEQGGLCKVCSEAEPDRVDHDHLCCPEQHRTCGQCVRGLVCSNCNWLVGMVETNLATLKKVNHYLDLT